ncbi:MAG: glycosyltransferase [Geminicoccales bacterium]
MKNVQVGVRLLGFIGHHDRDILPPFLSHYRSLGVDGFLLALHGDWPERSLDWLTRQDDVAIWDLLSDPYEDAYRRSILNLMAERFRGQWVLLADADEFLELPYPTLKSTIQALNVLGLDYLPAFLLQRMSEDGKLRPLDPSCTMNEQFSYYNFGLCEDMGVASPVWKTKYPISRVGDKFSIDRGNHWPPNPVSLAHLPIRAIVHHLKWRAALTGAFEAERGPSSNSDEMSCFKQWLDSHDGRLPMTHARAYSREAMMRQGLLVKPDRQHLLIGATLRQRRDKNALTDERYHRLARKLAHVLAIDHHPDVTSPLEPTQQTDHRTSEYGRVCLVTFDLSPPLTSGGIGTAMHALAEQLIAVGHDVDLLFCPYDGPQALWPLWHDYWQNRGARLHYLPRTEGEKRQYLSHNNFLSKITRFLETHQFDVLHVADAAGYGAAAAILRAAGLAFSKTKLVVTAHGGTAWHRRGNQLAPTEDEAEASFAERQMLRLADIVCCPSRYMSERLVADGQVDRAQVIVLPNALPSSTRSFGVADPSAKPVDELVMMGRIEHRKGIDRFAKAVRRLAAQGLTGLKITFLGKPGDGIEFDKIKEMLGPMGETVRFITHYDHIEAVNYVKTHDCLVVIPSLRENLPYSLYECLENHVPVLASDAGGMQELVAESDRSRILVAGNEDRLVEALEHALLHGMQPASLAFEPSVAGLKLALLHCRLVEEVRRHGNEPGLEEHSYDAPLHPLIYGNQDDGHDWASDANSRLAKFDGDLLYCHHAAVQPDDEALAAMVRLQARTNADAIVVGYRVIPAELAKPWDQPIKTPFIAAPGGPAEQGMTRNLFGAGLFLIRRSCFETSGGFATDLSSSNLTHWDLLNRLNAAGGDVIGIPRALASVEPSTADKLTEPSDPSFAKRLLQPWQQRPTSGKTSAREGR